MLCTHPSYHRHSAGSQKKQVAEVAPPHQGHSLLYLRCAIEEQQIFQQLVKWNKIVDYKAKPPKEGEHYTVVPWQTCYKSSRLSPTPGKWFLIGVSDYEENARREGIRHFYVHQEESVKDLKGIDDLQDECDEIVQYTRTYIIGDELTCNPPPRKS